MIHVNIDWKKLGEALGLSDFDIENIKTYDKKEHRQRLIETWYYRATEQEFCREKLHRAMMEASNRKRSYDSMSSVSSMPISPTGIYYSYNILIMLTSLKNLISFILCLKF